ncbi:hypothetical protein FOA52_005784 [Chlamydomonas sp. UWO 241]|nr:hypothetical protein FOA52_005784 [Chlamydomonas sp. UWO 241]
MQAAMLSAWWLLVALALALSCVRGASVPVNGLPANLLSPPVPLDPGAPVISSTIDLFTVPKRPRAVLGYMSDKDWALSEFVCMHHASWRYLSRASKTKIDLFAFSHPGWATSALSRLCTPVDLDKPFVPETHSHCYVIYYPVPPPEIWHGYPFINNVHFFADERVRAMITTNYGYVMKTDFDTFLAPMFPVVVPERLIFGKMLYQIENETAARLVRIAGDLGLRHDGRHNIGPTWLGDADTIFELGNRTIPVLYHILTKEFEQVPGGGVAQKFLEGEGWPTWCAGIAAMYATEIVANAQVEAFNVSDRMDVHGDSGWAVDEVIHIHCQHGDGHFNKFEFLKHHYDSIEDLSAVTLSSVRGYATKLAVSSWRMMTGQPQKLPKKQKVEKEL